MGNQANNTKKTSTYQQCLRFRRFGRYGSGKFVRNLQSIPFCLFFALRVYENTSSNTAVSGLFMAFGIPAVLFGLIAGTLVDRLDKRRVLMLCDLIRGVFVLALLFLSHNIIVVYLITFW